MAEHGSSGHASHAHAEHGSEHENHGGLTKYVIVFFALCVLTGASFFTYSDLWPFHSTPAVGWAFMMAVSCTKAMLVICFFMHLIWEANWKYVLTIPASIMSIFLCLALVGDIGMRTRYYSEERWLNSSEPIERATGHATGHADDAHEHDHNGNDSDHASGDKH
jgi:cytochrome c oxidase subunit 4